MARSCVVYRRAQFAASHRYWIPEWSETENQGHFGAGARFPGHGHNYVLQVGLIGEVDRLGMVRNLSDVKQVIRQQVLQDLNFAYLNEVWPEFQQALPTSEWIAHAIWHRLSPHLPLVSLKLYEDPELWAEYRGESMKAYLTVGSHFSAAHRLALDELSMAENTEIYGPCARVHGHGHNYMLEVTVEGDIHPRTGMIVDLAALQQVIDQQVVEPFDHRFLNKDIPYFAEVVPTAENIALRIQELLTLPIRQLGVRLHRVHLQESPNNSSEVYGEYNPEGDPLATPTLAYAGSH
ncbi:MAG: 6-carboxytetrahydropterin synthase [Cyanobacteriota bacterium]|nr:6-carboxytetrahydropterin synthase [Cyanobacteriota bacterium]